MRIGGRIESLWRYPVKSMRGEQIDEAYVSFSGVYGDRLYAFHSSAGHEGHPYLTAREQQAMLRYQPRFRHPEKAARPRNLAEAEGIAPGINPLHADEADLAVDVVTPSGDVLAIDDPGLTGMLTDGIGDKHALTLLRSERGMTDCRPISVLSIQTIDVLGKAKGAAIDPRRFRANIVVDFPSESGYVEDALIGRMVRLGSKAIISILEPDPRCKMVTLDPETGECDLTVLRAVGQAHDGTAGVYAAAIVEGTVRRGDVVEVVE